MISVDVYHLQIIKIQNSINSMEREILEDIYRGLKMNVSSKLV